MKIITLGKTNLKVNKNGFGALPIQRISEKEAVYLLHKAYDNGINFYDTARFYTDSEDTHDYTTDTAYEFLNVTVNSSNQVVLSSWRTAKHVR